MTLNWFTLGFYARKFAGLRALAGGSRIGIELSCGAKSRNEGRTEIRPFLLQPANIHLTDDCFLFLRFPLSEVLHQFSVEQISQEAVTLHCVI